MNPKSMSGWIVFAGILMLIAGVMAMFEGLIALMEESTSSRVSRASWSST